MDTDVVVAFLCSMPLRSPYLFVHDHLRTSTRSSKTLCLSELGTPMPEGKCLLQMFRFMGQGQRMGQGDREIDTYPQAISTPSPRHSLRLSTLRHHVLRHVRLRCFGLQPNTKTTITFTHNNNHYFCECTSEHVSAGGLGSWLVLRGEIP